MAAAAVTSGKRAGVQPIRAGDLQRSEAEPWGTLEAGSGSRLTSQTWLLGYSESWL